MTVQRKEAWALFLQAEKIAAYLRRRPQDPRRQDLATVVRKLCDQATALLGTEPGGVLASSISSLLEHLGTEIAALPEGAVGDQK